MEPAPRRPDAVRPVNAWLFFSDDSPVVHRGLAAADWRTGEMRVTGLLSDGARIRRADEQRCRWSSRGWPKAGVRFFPQLTPLSLTPPVVH
jgi:hypothetical protein